MVQYPLFLLNIYQPNLKNLISINLSQGQNLVEKKNPISKWPLENVFTENAVPSILITGAYLHHLGIVRVTRGPAAVSVYEKYSVFCP